MNSAPTAQPTAVRPLAVIYLRVSTKDQAARGGETEGFSIPAQREACLRRAEQLGAQVIAEFVDAGESARSANRPELQRMLAYVAEHKIGFVLVHKLDRLARSRIDDVAINMQLSSAGAQLVSCTENIDDTPSGMLMHGIMSSIAEFYSQNLATESKKGMRQKVKNGGTVNMVPFGYFNSRRRTAEGREMRTVEVDDERAPWVRFIFEKYARENWTVSQIRDHLEAAGVTSVPRPSRPSRPLAMSHLYSILRNRYYIGTVVFEGVEYAGQHPKLIDPALFAEAQRVRTARQQSKEKPRIHSHYLKGSLYCGRCRQPLTFEQVTNRHGNPYEYFFCLGRQRDKNGCDFRATPVALVEDLVERHWSTVTLRVGVVAEVRRLVQEHIRTVLPDADSAKRRTRDILDRLQRQSDKLLAAHYEDAISLADLKREQQRIAAERLKAETEIAKVGLDESNLLKQLERCCRLLSDAQQHYLAGTPSIRRELNQGVFDRIYVCDDDIVGSELTAAFSRLLSPSLEADLLMDARQVRTGRVRTSNLCLVSSDSDADHRGGQPSARRAELPNRARTGLSGQFGLGAVQHSHDQVSRDGKNPGPSEVRGSNVILLVAGAGFEPATSGL